MSTDSIAADNAAQSEFYRTHDRTVDAGPGLYDITPEDLIAMESEQLARSVLAEHGIHNDNWVRNVAQIRELLIEAIDLARGEQVYP